MPEEAFCTREKAPFRNASTWHGAINSSVKKYTYNSRIIALTVYPRKNMSGLHAMMPSASSLAGRRILLLED